MKNFLSALLASFTIATETLVVENGFA